MAEQPTVHLMCGLVGAGKTTVARQLAADLPAVRLSRDEWMLRLYGLPHTDPVYVERLGPCTDLLWDVAFDIVAVGADVILDWNFWSRDRRRDAVARTASADVAVRLHWVRTPVAETVRRAERRLTSNSPGAHRITGSDVEHFATIFEDPEPDEGLVILRHD